MQSKWIDQETKYDGTQLRSLYAYLSFGVLGDSIVAWRGPCDVAFTHMVDGEDLLQRSAICGSDMLHFIIEVFDVSLLAGVFLQRLMASITKDVIEKHSSHVRLRRDGDDLYEGHRKLSISIATSSPVSTMIHFAVNVNPAGAPVEACGIGEFGIDVKDFAKAVMEKLVQEFNSSRIATMKVRPVP
jgi:hypothetical protein